MRIDLILHILTGYLIASITSAIAFSIAFILTDDLTGSIYAGLITGLFMATLGGYWKEWVHDESGKGTVDKMDFWATVAGGITWCVVVMIVVLVVL